RLNARPPGPAATSLLLEGLFAFPGPRSATRFAVVQACSASAGDIRDGTQENASVRGGRQEDGLGKLRSQRGKVKMLLRINRKARWTLPAVGNVRHNVASALRSWQVVPGIRRPVA